LVIEFPTDLLTILFWLPVPNQVIMTKTLKKDVRSVCTKVLLQMNCKLGGGLWSAFTSQVNRGTMIVGVDSFRDKRMNRTCYGMVATLSSNMAQYFSDVFISDETGGAEGAASGLGLTLYSKLVQTLIFVTKDLLGKSCNFFLKFQKRSRSTRRCAKERFPNASSFSDPVSRTDKSIW
jgi:hypothetical protein